MTRMQKRQRKDSKKYTYNGETHTLVEWSEILGVTWKQIRRRMREGRPPEEVFATDRRVGENYGADKKKYFRKLEREAEERYWERLKDGKDT